MTAIRTRLIETLRGPGAPSRIALALAYAVTLPIAVHALWHYGIKVAVRLFEPGPTGWMEPQFLRSALEVVNGGSLYPTPSLRYIGTVYTPGADYLNAGVISIFGPGYLGPRLAAFLFFVGLLVLLAIWVYRATRDPWWTSAAVILQLSLCTPVDNWFSKLNIDAPYLALGTAGIALLYFAPHRRGPVIAAGLLLATAFLCKPQAIFWALAGFVVLLIHHRRRALEFAAVCGGLAALCSIALLVASDGWFWRSIVTVALATPDKVHINWISNLLTFSHLAVAGVVVVLPVVAVLWRRRRSANATLLMVWSAALLIQSYTSFARLGGGPKHLHVVAMFGLLLVGLLPALLSELGAQPSTQRLVKTGLLIVTALVITNGFGRSHHAARLVERHGGIAPARRVLFDKYRRFDARVERSVAAYDGAVFVGGRVQPSLHRQKPLNCHQTPLQHYLRIARLATFEEIASPSFAGHGFDALVLWNWWRPDEPMWADVKRDYRLVGELGLDPLIGMRVNLWERQQNGPDPP